jgi:acyl-coenzyme A synthetase/AMP-(fatty) acid ligase
MATREAVLCEGRRVTYGQLTHLVMRVTGLLQTAGLRKGERVILCLRDTEFLIAGLFGAMFAGMVPVVVALKTSADELRTVVDETDARLLIGEEDGIDIGASHPAVRRLSATEFVDMLGRGSAQVLDAASHIGSEAFWLFTSGTTGRIKGVVHGHHDPDPVLAYHLDALAMGPGTRVFCTSRLSFAYSLGDACFAPLALGATVVLHPDWPTAEKSQQVICKAKPQIVFSVPGLYRSRLSLPSEEIESAARLVSCFVSASEAPPPAIAERWEQMAGRPILDCYGSSETVFFVFSTSRNRPIPGSVGHRCASVATALRDEQGRPTTAGATGRLYIRHPSLARGYGPGAEAANERFRDGWFATGDRFRCADGH